MGVIHVPNGTYRRPAVPAGAAGWSHDSLLSTATATEVFVPAVSLSTISLNASPDRNAKLVWGLSPRVTPKRLPASRVFPLSMARPLYQSNTVPLAWPPPEQVRRADNLNSS